MSTDNADIETNLRLVGTKWIGGGICRLCPEEIVHASEEEVDAWHARHKAKHGIGER